MIKTENYHINWVFIDIDERNEIQIKSFTSMLISSNCFFLLQLETYDAETFYFLLKRAFLETFVNWMSYIWLNFPFGTDLRLSQTFHEIVKISDFLCQFFLFLGVKFEVSETNLPRKLCKIWSSLKFFWENFHFSSQKSLQSRFLFNFRFKNCQFWFRWKFT